jgi:hypothetical protein
MRLFENSNKNDQVSPHSAPRPDGSPSGYKSATIPTNEFQDKPTAFADAADMLDEDNYPDVDQSGFEEDEI